MDSSKAFRNKRRGGSADAAAQSYTITEYDVLDRYADADKMFTHRFMQAHHVFHDKLMREVFGPCGYNREAVPVMWLRSTGPGSPHDELVFLQRQYLQERLASGPTYADIRMWGVGDLKAVLAPTENIVTYLYKMDMYFETYIAVNARVTGRGSLIGDY